MSELMRFRVARSTQRLPLCESEAFIPLYRSANNGPQPARVMVPTALSAGEFFKGLLESKDTVAAADEYVADAKFVNDGSRLRSGIGRLDVWLACKNNRPTPNELKDFIKELGSSTAEELVNTRDWSTDRESVADSLVASMIADVDPSIRGFLHRLLLVFGLVELLIERPERLKTADDVYWALRWRTVLLASEFAKVLAKEA